MEFLEQFLANTSEGLAVCDRHFIQEFWNPAMNKITGVKEADAIGKHIFDVFPGIKETGFDKLLHQALQGENTTAKHFRYNHPVTRQQRWIKIVLCPNRNEHNQISGILAFVSDITYVKKMEGMLQKKEYESIAQNEEFTELTSLLKERNRDYLTINEKLLEANEKLRIVNKELNAAKEKAEESDRLKSAFLENLSHEIRTPMNAIVGFAQILENNIDCTDKNKEFTTLITQKSYELLDVIDEILEISGIELGQVKLTHEECNLAKLLDYLFIFFEKYKMRNGKDHINLVLRENMAFKEKIILTDKFKLRQIFKHLLYNAFKFTSQGAIEFGIYETDANYITFYVADTGCGIAEEQFDAIFEKFKQIIPKSHSRDGLGLGLSIVKGLVTLLDGIIWLKSEVKGGTTFYFSVRLNVPTPLENQTRALNTTRMDDK